MSKSIAKSDFDKICRLCLLREENMLSVYSANILKMLQCCTKLKIKWLDGLPHQICPQCENKVSAFYAFKQESEKSDQLLRKIFKENNEKVKKTHKSENTTDSLKLDNNDIKSEIDDFLIENLKVELDLDAADKANESDINSDFDFGDDLKTESTQNKDQNNRDSNCFVNKENNKHVCKICSKEFSEKGNLTKHLIRHKGEKKYKCEHCEKRFYEISAMASHAKQHNVKPVKCEVCHREFMLQLQLEMHSRQHKEFKHFCKTCGKGFRIKAKLKIHEVVHQKDGIFPCSKCDKWFKHKHSLKKHFMNFHEGTRKKEVCNQCGKMVVGLKRHIMMIHSTEKPHKCQQCTMTFAYVYYLKNHMKIHTGETKSYTELCNMCGKKFQTASDLKIHIRSHTGEKPYSCSVCNKAYKTQSALAVHKRLHTGQRPFSCHFCGKAFFTNNVLKGHLRIHTGEKPFACKVCGREFNQRQSLKTHMKVHE